MGFRWYTQRSARTLGLQGSVANLPDGSVRILAQGPAEALIRLESEVKRGPPRSQVLHLEVHEVVGLDLGPGFDIVNP